MLSALFSKSVTALPDSLGLGMTFELPEGCYGVKVDGTGKYTFDNVPVGDYYLIIISNDTLFVSPGANSYISCIVSRSEKLPALAGEPHQGSMHT